MPKTKEMKVEGITRGALEALKNHWERFTNCYFWSPPGNASGRRSEEARHYRDAYFKVDGEDVYVEIEVTCSCKNYYCSKDVYVDKVRKAQGLRYIKKVLTYGVFN